MSDLATKMIELADSIQRDDTGTLVAGQWMGGHGGLLSRQTLKLSDEGRKIALKEISEHGGLHEPSHQTDR